MTNKAKNDSVEYSLHRPAGQVHLTGDYVSISRATQFCSICPTFFEGIPLLRRSFLFLSRGSFIGWRYHDRYGTVK